MTSSSVSATVRAYNAALTNLYFHHRETVLHIQDTLRTQILPNVLDELALGNSAHDWAQEWLKDEREFTRSSALYSKQNYRVSHHRLYFQKKKVSIFRALKVRTWSSVGVMREGASLVCSRDINSQRRLR